MSKLLRKSIWYYVALGTLAALWFALQIADHSFDANSVEVLFSNFIIPITILILVLVSSVIKQQDELLSLLLLLFATYVHLTPGIEKNSAVTFIILIIFPILFIIRMIQFVKRNGLENIKTRMPFLLFLIIVYAYILVYYR